MDFAVCDQRDYCTMSGPLCQGGILSIVDIGLLGAYIVLAGTPSHGSLTD